MTTIFFKRLSWAYILFKQSVCSIFSHVLICYCPNANCSQRHLSLTFHNSRKSKLIFKIQCQNENNQTLWMLNFWWSSILTKSGHIRSAVGAWWVNLFLLYLVVACLDDFCIITAISYRIARKLGAPIPMYFAEYTLYNLFLVHVCKTIYLQCFAFSCFFLCCAFECAEFKAHIHFWALKLPSNSTNKLYRELEENLPIVWAHTR